MHRAGSFQTSIDRSIEQTGQSVVMEEGKHTGSKRTSVLHFPTVLSQTPLEVIAIFEPNVFIAGIVEIKTQVPTFVL